MSKPPEIPSIDPAALAAVTGGTASYDSTGLIAGLNNIIDNVKQIQSAGNANGLNPQDMMLFMMLMQRNQQQQTVVAAPAAPTYYGWPGGTWYY